MTAPGERTGYTEVAPGVKSSTRLIALLLTGFLGLLILTLCVYVLWLGRDASPGMVAALGAVITTVGVSCLVVIIKRDIGDDSPAPAALGGGV